MRVLIVTDDLYLKVGGGQTFYRRLIATHPDITFCYFRREEPADTSRPANTETLLVGLRPAIQVTSPVLFPPLHRDSLAEALCYARAARGQRFDITDLPDFLTLGPFLRQAFADHNCYPGAIVLSMHGSISQSVRHAWEGDPGTLDLDALEEMQFANADARYAISSAYSREWRERIDAPVTVFDPRSILTPTPLAPFRIQLPPPPPTLLLIGRRERRKGDDVALDILSWIDRGRYSKIVLIGDDVPTQEGDSASRLRLMAQRRGIKIEILPAMPRAELVKLYGANAALICATRQDSLNLVVLEAAAAGCPIAVSNRAGVAEFLRSSEISYPVLTFDIDDRAETINALDGWLENFPVETKSSHSAATTLLAGTPDLDLRPIYEAARSTTPREQIRIHWQTHAWKPQRLTDPVNKGLARARTRLEHSALYPTLRSLARTTRRASRFAVSAFRKIAGSDAANVRAAANAMPERSVREVSDKLDLLRTIPGNAPHRVTFWLEAARLERLLGRDLVASAYELRGVRLTGASAPQTVDRIANSLEKIGFSEIAHTTRLWGNTGGSPHALTDHLSERRTLLLQRPDFSKDSLALEVDQRTDTAPKVSVIVSLYNGAAHLPLFLKLLQRQTLPPKLLELIIIDSTSLDKPLPIIQANIGSLSSSLLYIRTKQRETIQAAWNRGLMAARGEYVSMLGVDETLLPNALERLASILDKVPTVDWAQGSSLVTSVTMAGGHLFDKMHYDRTDAFRDMALLDTTYVSWVGGMYRRNLHERVGWYDPKFRAAGDTEFKMRTLGEVNVAFTSETLGLFLDYPADRTTASALAEVEDMLAWYAHRTLAGVTVLADDRSNAQLWELLRACANYRKCFRSHRSTDIDFAASIANRLAAAGDVRAIQLANDFNAMQSALQSREHAERVSEVGTALAVEGRIRSLFQTQRTRHQRLLELSESPPYDILNDNRFEQHNWYW